MSKYPIYLDLNGRRVVVIGAGAVAARKVLSLSATGARVVVVAEHATKTFEEACSGANIELILSAYSKDYLAEAVLAIAATNDAVLNHQIYKDCQQLEVLCNVVDEPEFCDFYVPAVVERGSLQIAIGTDGKCPAYAGHLRRKLEEMFTEQHGEFVDALDAARKQIIALVEDAADRKAILGELVTDESFDYFVQNGLAAWQERARSLIAEKTR
ncbi:MAG TPA: bifunctional precorrin-2 dehydrogenase/sirohydrochlorin ferrochelatase [Anaerohalosphaeraceae bacterium]|jgi:precorrin-2 dehydrogenase/sirohydrochlorin ferrochelatase|nr:bifunctional precorrin-2 dehydrogenase/sirohydrochlorin ferrochelatase [Anaerohalosphaeraceae bacterium]HRT50066.1 bifunctional precorrin-2 dehydrogenase/sirohydrochlorin ferrochelatase [Anaerohalosphaeraceae bacterium]HRT85869.1 bifunctional precorrin-2 dehydrogenase/sirohydrochlorin ferrochelatase [Anaerohalosphaeraceae bacterium]